MQIEWAAVAAIASVIVVFGTAAGWFIAVGKLSARVKTTEEQVEKAGQRSDAIDVALKTRVEKAEERSAHLELALNEHKIAVAKEMVGRETIERMEAKIFEAIDSIGKRFEAAIGSIGQRIDSLVDRKTT